MSRSPRFTTSTASQYLGENCTNNEAEYHGLVVGLQEARQKGVPGVVVHGDSQLVIEQLRGNYRVQAENLKPLWRKAVELKKQFPAGVSLVHIDRDRNRRADQLANEAMDRRHSEEYSTELWDSGTFLPRGNKYWNMGMPELRQECKNRKVSYSVTKKELVASLLASELQCDEDFVQFVEQKNWSSNELLVQCKALQRRWALEEREDDGDTK
mmetsp:Transcript_21898/g.42534  ORF Transcript_21898/g.42534 Transcript_21898/m.42534 type:complete len:212 (+) Transcript_21898:242-877(+)